MSQLADTLTTREAVRRATADDIVGRCQVAAVAIEGGALDGVEVVSLGTLRDQVAASLGVELPPPSEKYAEVITPATVTVSAVCPECKEIAEISVTLRPRLTVEGGVAEIAVKAKSKAVIHMHGQLTLPVEGQVGMDEIGEVVIDDLRLRILRAVADVSDAHAAEIDPGPAPTLDAIAKQLELVSETDIGDLEDSLYSYSQLEAALVEVVSVVGEPVTYVLTDAGIDMVGADDDDPTGEPELLADELDSRETADDADPDDAP